MYLSPRNISRCLRCPQYQLVRFTTLVRRLLLIPIRHVSSLSPSTQCILSQTSTPHVLVPSPVPVRDFLRPRPPSIRSTRPNATPVSPTQPPPPVRRAIRRLHSGRSFALPMGSVSVITRSPNPVNSAANSCRHPIHPLHLTPNAHHH